MEHILSARQFDPDQINDIFERTDYMKEQLADRGTSQELANRHHEQYMVTLFYEPSTRTRISFEIAAQRIGMKIASTESAGQFSSAVKGETLEDTISTVERYGPRIVVLRSKEDNAAERAAAKATKMNIINAGDGSGEHPTQALLDLYTINQFRKTTEGLKVVIGGDLAKGRTARSLALLLSHYHQEHITFVSLPELQIGADIKEHLKEVGTPYDETTDMFEAIQDADVVYWTRLQLERPDEGEDTARAALGLEHNYVIGQTALQAMKDDVIIMHPLPRNNEVDISVDTDSRAKYFDQVENGMYVRMALLDMLLRR